MLIQETLESGLIKSYSDAGFMIKQVETGILYAEAIDVPNKYTYEETSEKIEREEVIIEDENKTE